MMSSHSAGPFSGGWQGCTFLAAIAPRTMPEPQRLLRCLSPNHAQQRWSGVCCRGRNDYKQYLLRIPS